MGYIAFPWEQAGILLRKMSLAGAAGNVAAWILYLVLCGWPLVCGVLLARRGKGSRVDLLLPVLSLVLFPGLWLLVNPSYLEGYLFAAGMGEIGICAVSLTIDSVLLSWLLLRFLRNGTNPGRVKLLRSLELLLGVYVVLAIIGILFQGGGELREAWGSVGAAVSEPDRQSMDWLPAAGLSMGRGERSIGLSRFVLILQLLCRYLPQALELILGVAAIGFLRSCEQGSFQEKSLKRLQGLMKLSGYFLGAVLVGNVCVNLLQVALAGYIYSTSFVLVLPLRQMIVMLGVLLLSRFWLESKKLQEDNQLFV